MGTLLEVNERLVSALGLYAEVSIFLFLSNLALSNGRSFRLDGTEGWYSNGYFYKRSQLSIYPFASTFRQ